MLLLRPTRPIPSRIKASLQSLYFSSYIPPYRVPNYLGSNGRNTRTMASATSFYDFKPLDSMSCSGKNPNLSPELTPILLEKHQPYPLSSLKGKVVLVVNTASKCGFTPQLEGLEKLYKSLSSKHPDFLILGFPCNQFGSQDPGSDDTIQEFCLVNYGVSFPILAKTDVNGDKAEPVWEWMKKEVPGVLGLKRVKWNFEKFLIGKDGTVKGRWASTSKPESLEPVIVKELEKGAKSEL